MLKGNYELRYLQVIKENFKEDKEDVKKSDDNENYSDRKTMNNKSVIITKGTVVGHLSDGTPVFEGPKNGLYTINKNGNKSFSVGRYTAL